MPVCDVFIGFCERTLRVELGSFHSKFLTLMDVIAAFCIVMLWCGLARKIVSRYQGTGHVHDIIIIIIIIQSLPGCWGVLENVENMTLHDNLNKKIRGVLSAVPL